MSEKPSPKDEKSAQGGENLIKQEREKWEKIQRGVQAMGLLMREGKWDGAQKVFISLREQYEPIFKGIPEKNREASPNYQELKDLFTEEHWKKVMIELQKMIDESIVDKEKELFGSSDPNMVCMIIGMHIINPKRFRDEFPYFQDSPETKMKIGFLLRQTCNKKSPYFNFDCLKTQDFFQDYYQETIRLNDVFPEFSETCLTEEQKSLIQKYKKYDRECPSLSEKDWMSRKTKLEDELQGILKDFKIKQTKGGSNIQFFERMSSANLRRPEDASPFTIPKELWEEFKRYMRHMLSKGDYLYFLEFLAVVKHVYIEEKEEKK